MTTRNLAFDQAKGVLIILVIVGHVVLGDMSETPLRKIIYFFHMPLFLAITGYFIKKQLLKYSTKDIILKYRNRMLIPFMVAFVFYNVLSSYDEGVIGVLKSFINPYPYYHLWYIPAILIFVFYLKLFSYLLDKGFKNLFVFLLFIYFSLTLYFETYLQWGLYDNVFYKILGDKRFYYFFSYFTFGFFLAQYKHQLVYNVKYFLIAIGVGLLLFNLAIFDYVVGFGKVLTNLGLIGLVIYTCEYQKIPSSKILAKIGVVSLPIYLWHVAPILVLQKLPINLSMYYGISLLFFIFFIAMVIYFEDKNAIMNRIFYGKT